MPPPPALIGTSLLAWRNLSHDRARFIVTLIGVGFAVLLMGVELGLLVGFARTTSGLVDHSRAALWITPAGTTNVDIAGRMDERRRFQALAVPGVASVGKLMLQFGFWKKPDGGNESVALVGFEIESEALQPWNLVEGRIADLQQQDAVIIDRLYADKLGVKAIGDTIEINSQRARVVGFTRGLRTFTQSPYVWMTHRNALAYSRYQPEQTTYLLVGLEPGADVEVVRHALTERLGRVDVWKRADFARQAQKYWLITTGAGSALLLSALLGLVVGIVIVGQTLYATNGGSPARVCNAARDGCAGVVSEPGHPQAGGDQRRVRLQPRHASRVCDRGDQRLRQRRRDRAVVAARRACRAHRADVRVWCTDLDPPPRAH